LQVPFVPRKYYDDQAFLGLAFLDAADATVGPPHDEYVNAARELGDFMIASSAWDDVCGGGYWWHSDKTVKATHENALAAQLFWRLYDLFPRETRYRERAREVLQWLVSTHVGLFDGRDGLYAWYVEPARDGRCVVNRGRFSQDQGSVIEALVRAERSTGDPRYLRRAQAVASAMIDRLWDNQRGGFVFNTINQGCRLSPQSSSRASRALVELYAVDPNPLWLDFAKRNVDVLNRALRDPSTGAYRRLGCGDGSNLETDFLQSVDQAAMQEVQAMLAAITAGRAMSRPSPPSNP
jgi:uncharacterized protein YyaL (SSP411 family)